MASVLASVRLSLLLALVHLVAGMEQEELTVQVEQEEEVCTSDDPSECASAMSLRQLRGEYTIQEQSISSDGSGEEEDEEAEEAADAEDEGEEDWFWLKHGNAKVNVPLFHLAHSVSTGMGVFMEAKVGKGSSKQYVTLLLDSGSVSMAVLGSESQPTSSLAWTCGTTLKTVMRNINHTEPALPQCTLQDFRSSNKGRCGLGGYELSKSTSAEPWPLGGSKLCPVKKDLEYMSGRWATKSGGPCNARTCYGDGSGYQANLVKDFLSIGSYSQKVPIHAISNVAGVFQEAPSAGIIGVASKALNCASHSDPSTCYPGAMQQLLISQGLERKLGLCLGEPPEPSSTFGTPGLLSLGGIDHTLAVGEPLFTPLSGSKYYTVKAHAFGLNGQKIATVTEAEGLATIVDTGAAALLLPKEIAPYYRMKCYEDPKCVINVQLEHVCLNIVGVSYRSIGSSKTTMLGYPALKSLYMLLDLEHHHVGFAARSDKACNAECSTFLSEVTCGYAKGCHWAGSHCAGGQSSGGSTSRGSTVSKANQCFTVSLASEEVTEIA